jgi:hypothetical protein
LPDTQQHATATTPLSLRVEDDTFPQDEDLDALTVETADALPTPLVSPADAPDDTVFEKNADTSTIDDRRARPSASYDGAADQHATPPGITLRSASSVRFRSANVTPLHLSSGVDPYSGILFGTNAYDQVSTMDLLLEKQYFISVLLPIQRMTILKASAGVLALSMCTVLTHRLILPLGPFRPGMILVMNMGVSCMILDS